MDATHTDRAAGWIHLIAFLLTTFYLCLLGFLVFWVVVPAMGFRLDPLVITSGSMGPLIQEGDVVLVDPAERTDTLGVGTVITYRQQGRFEQVVTHRIVGLDDEGYRTKGDANQDPDAGLVHEDQILGVARLLVPRIGGPSQWLGTTPLRFLVWLACTGIACLVALRPPDDPEPLTVEIEDGTDVARPSWAASAGSMLLAPVRGFVRRLVAPRPRASAPRRWGPVVVVPLVAALLSPTVVAAVAVVVVAMTVLVLDPAGPEIRVGRMARRGAVAAGSPTVAAG